MLTYDPAKLPAGTDVSKLSIVYFDESTKNWVKVESVVSPSANMVSAKVSHFTNFTIMSLKPGVGAGLSWFNWWLIGGIIMAVIVMGVVGLVVVRRRMMY